MDHASTMRRLYDLINAGDIDGFGEHVAEDFVEHEETPGLEPSKEGVKQLFRMYRAAFPDLRMEAEDVLVSGDKVVARVRARRGRGKHGASGELRVETIRPRSGLRRGAIGGGRLRRFASGARSRDVDRPPDFGTAPPRESAPRAPGGVARSPQGPRISTRSVSTVTASCAPFRSP